MVKIGDVMKVDRSDVLDFPGDAVDLLMLLQKNGWRAQRSNRNHVMLLAPDGVSRYSLSKNPNSAKYLMEDVRRYEKGEKSLSKEEIDRMNTEVVEDVVVTEKFPCPHTNCFKTFMSQDHLNVHIGVDHENMLVCPEKDCFELFTRPQSLGRHRQIKHGYESPNYKKRKAKEEERRQAEDAMKTSLLMGEGSNGVNNARETVEKVLGEASESTGRILDGSRFDSSLAISQWTGATPSEPQMDELPIDAILGNDDKESLKHAVGSNFDPDVTIAQHNYADKNVSPAEIYRHTRAQLRSRIGESVTEHVDFIDERDSWTLDLTYIDDMPIRDVARVLYAAGMNLEMRVWKEKD